MKLDMILVENLYNLHLKGVMTSDLAREHSIRPATLYYAFKRLGPVERGFKSPILDWNKIFPILTPEAAYIYGLWYADGCNTGKKLTIKLHEQDLDLLQAIQKYLCCNSVYKDGSAYKLILHPGRKQEIPIDWFPRRKSYSYNVLHQIPTELYSHFIRGYFDGDGCISVRKARPKQILVYICSVDEKFLINIQNILKSFDIETRIYKEDRAKLGFQNMFTLRVGTHTDRLKFYNFIYKNVNFKMQRKFLKYELYANTVLNSKISKGLESV